MLCADLFCSCVVVSASGAAEEIDTGLFLTDDAGVEPVMMRVTWPTLMLLPLFLRVAGLGGGGVMSTGGRAPARSRQSNRNRLRAQALMRWVGWVGACSGCVSGAAC